MCAAEQFRLIGSGETAGAVGKSWAPPRHPWLKTTRRREAHRALDPEGNATETRKLKGTVGARHGAETPSPPSQPYLGLYWVVVGDGRCGGGAYGGTVDSTYGRFVVGVCRVELTGYR
jgi:hypothetical protein